MRPTLRPKRLASVYHRWRMMCRQATVRKLRRMNYSWLRTSTGLVRAAFPGKMSHRPGGDKEGDRQTQEERPDREIDPVRKGAQPVLCQQIGYGTGNNSGNERQHREFPGNPKHEMPLGSARDFADRDLARSPLCRKCRESRRAQAGQEDGDDGRPECERPLAVLMTVLGFHVVFDEEALERNRGDQLRPDLLNV